MKSKEVIVHPFDHAENDYIKLLIECIRKAGYVPVRQRGNRIKAGYILYNWYENMNGVGGLLLLRKLIMLNYYKLLRKKIIWVMHNKHPHDSDDKYSQFMMRYLARRSDAIMILCDETYESLYHYIPEEYARQKTFKVPLITYETIIGNTGIKESDDDLHLLFFGRIQPYKCIETLIDAINESKYIEHLYLTIAGSSRDDEYIRLLKKKIGSNKKISLIPKYISYEELRRLVSESDAFVIPMDTNSCLNSSSIMMAFSLARTVICPVVGTIKEINNYEQLTYTYNYNSPREHIDVLERTIDKAYEERETLSKKGEELLYYIRDNNSIEYVSECIKMLLNNAN